MGAKMGIGYPYHHDTCQEPSMILTVDQIERLAKAGVSVELSHKVTVQDPSPEPPEPHRMATNDIGAGIRERWMQSQRAKATALNDYNEFAVCPTLYAHQHDDKVYVFAYSGNAPPEIIEDDACIYPSDALLARIHLMMQHAK